MTFYFVNLMWAIVLFGVLIWTTACVALNAALRGGMRLMGMVLSYGVLLWMIVALPWREVAATWGLFAAAGGFSSIAYELWARRRYAGTGRRARGLIRLEGALMWPAMIPDAVGLMLNDVGLLPTDARREQHQDDRAGSTSPPTPPTD